MKVKFLIVAIVFILSFNVFATETNDSIVGNRDNASFNLTSSDFSINYNGKVVSLGEPWNNESLKLNGKELSHNFVGDVPSGNMSYKFYQHNFADYSLFTSNAFWDKYNRSIDDYIIAQITLSNNKIHTNRGLSIGNPLTKLKKKYGDGVVDKDDGEYWVEYIFDGKRISFEIDNGIITSIMMVVVNDN